MTIFFYFAINLLMVVGLAPVVGIPLPLFSYGGSAMLTVMICLAFSCRSIATRAATAGDRLPKPRLHRDLARC
jgi:cell division protein FtsW (lipid II flippase)